MGIPAQSKGCVRFGKFELDPRTGELRTNGYQISLQEKPFRILIALLERPGELVTREELTKRLWPADTFVEFDLSLNKAVNRLREVLEDSAEQPRFIETLPRRGYRFIAPLDRKLSQRGDQDGWPQVATSVPLPTSERTQLRFSRSVLLLLAAAGLILLFTGAFFIHRERDLAPPGVIRFPVFPPEKLSFRTKFALSPDGRRLAFVAGGPVAFNAEDEKTLLWIRPIDALSAQPLSGTEGAFDPFWAPDGEQIGFFANGELKKIRASGGPPETVCRAPDGKGGTWNSQGIILFSPTPESPIFKVPAGGGDPVQITNLAGGEAGHLWPYFLPDGRHFLYLAGVGSAQHENRGIYVASLDSEKRTRILSADSRAVYSVPGYLVFSRNGTLMAEPFDDGTLLITGEPFVMAQDVAFFEPFGAASFSVSGNGVLAYLPEAGRSRLVWFDRTGREVGTVGNSGVYVHVELSRDEKNLVAESVQARTNTGAIWQIDLSRHTETRVTPGLSWEYYPIWSFDGKRILYSSNRELAKAGSPGDLYLRDSAGAGTEEVLLKSDAWKWPDDWSPDGRFVLFETWDQYGKSDLWTLDLHNRGRLTLQKLN
jgi:eukaryotic-like serine/threonine-protein kinase